MRQRNNLAGRTMYKSFIPSRVEEYEFDVNASALQELSRLSEKLAASALSEEGTLRLIRMEAEDSWRLAGEQSVSLFPMTMPCDGENVENIVRATLYGARALEELPISTRLIRNLHYLICAGSDYDRKYRGEYRTSPVWIGKPGNGLSEALFVPPAPDDMHAAIADLENYINYSDDNVFVKAAIFHYQFEMIHPFIDGNGRTGRLLNNLFLTENGVLPAPVLLLSHIIARDYNRYCDEIQHVNETGCISSWIGYWLTTLAESLKYTLQVIDSYSSVKYEYTDRTVNEKNEQGSVF